MSVFGCGRFVHFCSATGIGALKPSTRSHYPSINSKRVSGSSWEFNFKIIFGFALPLKSRRQM